ADEIEGEFLIKGCVDRGRRADKGERRAVGRRAHDGLAADMGAATRRVLNDKWLAEPLRQPLSYQASENIGRAARRDWHDQTHWPRRIGLRPRHAQDGRQGGSA